MILWANGKGPPRKPTSWNCHWLKAFWKAPDCKDGAEHGGTGAEGDSWVSVGGISSQFVTVAVFRALESDCLLSNLAFIPCQLCDLG